MKYLACTLLLAVAAPAVAQQPQNAPVQAQAREVTYFGGYAPAAPALRGTPEPGSPIVFQPSAAPADAFPAPQARDHYPACKAGQTDHCREVNGPR